jgi:putative glutamine amidotransferase
MKPVIGVTPDFNAGDRPDMGGREPTYFLRARYVRAIDEAGAVPLILPLTGSASARRRLFDSLHGVLLTGSGPDLPPALYGERQRYEFRVVSRQRYDFEFELARLAADRGLPLLGICGGMQALNVALGGSLVQDIPAQVATPLPHRQPQPATSLSHGVRIAPRTLLRKIAGCESLRVNSHHHQAVKEVAGLLVASAVAPDGVIEAVEGGPSLADHPFLLGVQWHPEFLYERHAAHRRLFTALVRAAQRGAKGS